MTETDGRKETNGTAALPQLLLRAEDAADVCGCSVRTWRAWDATGKVPRPIRFGRTTRWRIDELRAWVDAGCPDRATWEARQ